MFQKYFRIRAYSQKNRAESDLEYLCFVFRCSDKVDRSGSGRFLND